MKYRLKFRVIRGSVAKVKLTPDLVVGDSCARVSRGDLPKFSIIPKSTRYQHTVLQLLSTHDPADAAVSQISAVSLARLPVLQEEYRQLLVNSQFDPAAFTQNSIENLQRAVSINIRSVHLVGVDSFPPGEAAAGLDAARVHRTARGAAVDKAFSQLTGAGRGAGVTLTCHVLVASAGDRPG